jgi:hypothetical protein
MSCVLRSVISMVKSSEFFYNPREISSTLGADMAIHG